MSLSDTTALETPDGAGAVEASAEEQLRARVSHLVAENARLVAAQALARIGSWETDLLTLEVNWSAETHRIFELDPTTFEPTHERFLRLVHPDDRASVDQAFAASAALRSACCLEHRLLMPDGRIKIVEERWQTSADDEGRPIRAWGTCQDITERKRAEHRIERRDRILSTTLSSLSDLAYAFDRDGRFVFANQPLLDLLGRTLDDVVGRNFFDLKYPDDLASRMQRQVQEVFDTKKSITDETAFTSAAGEAGYYEYIFSPALGADGAVDFVVGSTRDITARKRAVEETARINRALQMLSRCNDALIHAASEQELLDRICGVAVGVGGYRMAFVGWAEDDATQSINPVAHAGVEQGYLEKFKLAWNASDPLGRGAAGRVIRTGQAVITDDITQDPSLAFWSQAARQRGYRGVIRLPIREANRTLGLLGLYSADRSRLGPGELELLQEVADNLGFGIGSLRAQAERTRLQDQVREQATLLDITREAILVMDLDDRIVYWNKGAEATYGWRAADVLGRTTRECINRNDAVFENALAAVLATGGWHGELTQLTSDGREITVDAGWTLVLNSQGGPKSILAINTEITEKKRLEAQFLRAQRMESIGTLAGGIAHDLNNVLAPIMLSVEMLRDVVTKDDDLELLTTVEASAQRGADLVKQVLSFARGVEGQRMTVNPILIMRDLLKVMRDTFPKSITVRFTTEPDLWTVIGDATQVHQIFLNLCLNARDALPGGGPLTITMKNVVLDEVDREHNPDGRPGSYIVVTVQDAGTGIAADVRQRIFEPFFTTKGPGKGTGLGLSTTLAIVKSHNGFVTLESAVGKGTTVDVYLPANTNEAAEHRAIVEPTRLPRGNGELVLVVDDEEAIRKVAQATLTRFGYRVKVACDGTEAISIYGRHREDIAVVLTDMSMPVMEGPALIRALTVINPHVIVIGTSGRDTQAAVAQAVGADLHHFLPKPYTADALVRMLHHALRGPQR